MVAIPFMEWIVEFRVVLKRVRLQLSKPLYPWITTLENIPKQHEFSKLYVHMCLMKYLINNIQPKNDFTGRLDSLFTKYPNVDPDALGMKPNWINEPLWQQ